MSVNSSFPSNSSLGFPVYHCFNSTVTTLIYSTFNITRVVLLLPLSILVLYLGHQRWRQQRSFTTTCHSDIFTYHTAAMELIWVLGSAFFFCGSTADLPQMITGGVCLSSITYCGENFFHLLTCVERYLAVVHPITYLGLRKARGVRIRNISIGCVWLLSLVLASVIIIPKHPIVDSILSLCLLVFSLVVLSFSSLSVLHVLIRPGPGNRGRDKDRIDQSKQKAFITITVITGMLWFWFVGFLVSISLEASPQLRPSVGCVAKASALWFNLPSSLVLPLLYLHRAGKPLCCFYNGG